MLGTVQEIIAKLSERDPNETIVVDIWDAEDIKEMILDCRGKVISSETAHTALQCAYKSYDTNEAYSNYAIEAAVDAAERSLMVSSV